MKYLLSLFVVLPFSLLSQTPNKSDSTDSVERRDPNWKLKTILSLNGTQSSYVNWAAGGRNNITLLGLTAITANYSKGNYKFDNSLTLALGGLKYTGEGLQGADRFFQKTDDRIEFSSTAGKKITPESLYLSFVSGFRTQFLDGFNFPNDSVRISSFMAPGYLNFALGLEYIPNNNLKVFLSPIAAKFTFVQSQDLADRGAFGVKPAETDAAGNLLPGEKFRSEYGAYFRFQFNKAVMENVELKSNLELFTNYKENPENIDVNAEMSWYFKVNRWLSASLQSLLIYDDDIQITDMDGNTGPRTQFKTVLSLGLSYTLKNYDEKK